MESSTLIYFFNASNAVNVTEFGDIGSDAELISNQESLNKIAPVLFVMIATLIGNLVLIVAIINKKSRRRKRVNVFIVNLAVADLTVACITMTTELLEAMFKQWVLGAVLCKLLLYFQVVTLSSTTFLLTGMSIDRYQILVRPLKSLRQRPKIKSKVVIAWVMAFVVSLPQVLIFVQTEVHDKTTQKTYYYCKSAGYTAEWQRKFYFTFQTFYILLLPAGIMLFCYTEIAMAIWKRGGKDEHASISAYVDNSGSTRMSIKSNVISASKRKVVFMTLSVILAYLMCLTPYFIICLIRIFSHYSLDLKYQLTISQTIFMLHSALNPILYGLFTLRAAHIISFFSHIVRRRHDRKPANYNQHRNIIRKPHFAKLREGTIFFRRGNNGETGVIITNHAAVKGRK